MGPDNLSNQVKFDVEQEEVDLSCEQIVAEERCAW